MLTEFAQIGCYRFVTLHQKVQRRTTANLIFCAALPGCCGRDGVRSQRPVDARPADAHGFRDVRGAHIPCALNSRIRPSSIEAGRGERTMEGLRASMPPGPSSRVLAKLKVNGELNILRGHFQQRLLSNRCANPLGGQKALGGPLSEKFMALHVRPPGPDMSALASPSVRFAPES
jgi:hypothetical protein